MYQPSIKPFLSRHHPFLRVSQTSTRRKYKYKKLLSKKTNIKPLLIMFQTYDLSSDNNNGHKKWPRFARVVTACVWLPAVCSTQATSADGHQIQIRPQDAGLRAGARVRHYIQPSCVPHRFPPVSQAAVSHTTSLSDFRLILSFCFSIALSSSDTFFTSCGRPGTGGEGGGAGVLA